MDNVYILQVKLCLGKVRKGGFIQSLLSKKTNLKAPQIIYFVFLFFQVGTVIRQS